MTAPAPSTLAAPGRRADRVLAALALMTAAIAGWAAWRSARAGADVPDDATWRRAAELVRAQRQPGDLVTFAPAWIEPVGRMHLGDLISIEDAGRADAARYRRVWVLSIRDARAPEVAGERAALAVDVGRLHLARYDRAPVTVLASFADELRRAEITGAMARAPERVLAEVGFSPRWCVQVVPAPGGAVRLELPSFALGSELVAWAGLADVFTRRDVREPGHLELLLDGVRVAERSLGVEDGWVRLAAPTRPGRARLTVIASAPSPRARERLICFAVESRR